MEKGFNIGRSTVNVLNNAVRAEHSSTNMEALRFAWILIQSLFWLCSGFV